MAVPRIEEYRTGEGGSLPERMERLERYTAELSRELLYVLAHLDDGNLDPRYLADLEAKLKRSAENE